MSTTMSSQRKGPIEERAWPTQLDAHAVTPGPCPRLHGYDVENELAPSGSMTEIALLALTGELPSRSQLAAAEVVLQFAAAVSVVEASVHAAVLAKLSGASVSGLVAIAATGLAEQVRAELAQLGDWPDQLAVDTRAAPPMGALAKGADDRAACDRLAKALERTGLDVPAVGSGVSRFAALVAVLVACGVRGASGLIGLFVSARLPTALAEAAAVKVADFRSYPMDVPRFVYEGHR